MHIISKIHSSRAHITLNRYKIYIMISDREFLAAIICYFNVIV